MQATEFNNDKEIKYIYVEKGSYPQSDSAPSITITIRDKTNSYTDNKSNKMLTRKGSKLIISYENDTKSDGYEILMVPYSYSDEWSIVKGDVKEIVNVDGGFIGLVVPKNIDSNEIIIKFSPRGFNIGLLISIGSILIYGLTIGAYILFEKKRLEVNHAKTHYNYSSL